MLYFDGVKSIVPNTSQREEELLAHLGNAPAKLISLYNEMKVCAGIYKLSDDFDRIFSTLKLSIDVGDISLIHQTIKRLADGEMIILDELRESADKLWEASNELRAFLNNQNTVGFQKRMKKLHRQITKEVKQIKTKRSVFLNDCNSVISRLI